MNSLVFWCVIGSVVAGIVGFLVGIQLGLFVDWMLE